MLFVRVDINIRHTTMLTTIYVVFCSNNIIILGHKSDYLYTLESIQVNNVFKEE